mmetsp:Transcript_30641/g.47023  ORF Transcript_30641/g.47023 Transcript_30641/m.47023 type:complete len:376 (+) Transcript_30641:50-1177(+)
MKLFALSFIQLTLYALIPSLSNGLGYYDESSCGCHNDPHFHTWDGVWYDYQGVCEVVLIKKIADPLDLNDTLSVELHIATEQKIGYSSIQKVGLRINGENKVFEDPTAPGSPFILGGYDVGYSTSPYNKYEVDLGGGYFIRIIPYTFHYSVQVHGDGALFMNSEGMCGSWNSGGVADRFGVPFTSSDTLDWATHWQVQASEAIFALNGETCTAPPECGKEFPDGEFPCKGSDDQRTLVQHELESDCEKSCNDIPAQYPELRNNCYYDVIVTGDNSFACQPAYIDPVVDKPDKHTCDDAKCVSSKPNVCEKNGGRCVRKCETSLKVSCNPWLCKEYKEIEPFPDKPDDKVKPIGKDRCACAIPVKPTRPYLVAVGN